MNIVIPVMNVVFIWVLVWLVLRTARERDEARAEVMRRRSIR